MSAPRRCLVCRNLNEPYAARCSCGASLDLSADESRRVVARAASLAGWWAVLWAIATVLSVGVAIAAATGGGRPAGWLIGLAIIGGCSAIAACVRACRSWVVARARLAAIPDLPRAELRR
jgi:hypothetical protein